MELVKVNLYPLPPDPCLGLLLFVALSPTVLIPFTTFCDLFQILLPWLTPSIIYKESLANFMKMGYLFYAFEYLAFSGIMSNDRAEAQPSFWWQSKPHNGFTLKRLKTSEWYNRIHLEFPDVMIKLPLHATNCRIIHILWFQCFLKQRAFSSS